MSASPESKESIPGSESDSGPGESSLSFDPLAYEETRRAGQAAYRALHEALWASDLGGGDRDPSRWVGAVLAELPPADEGPLPMRVLACLGGNATWGALERFFHEPKLTDGETPASQPLRAWYRTYAADFDRFFPEQRNPGYPDPVDWNDDESPLWTRLERASLQFGRATEREVTTGLSFFVLLRDNASALGPVAERLEIELDGLARAAFSDSGPGRSIDEVRVCYEELQEDGFAPGPAAAFAAFVLRGETGATTSLGGRWSEEVLREAVRGAGSAEKGSAVLNFDKRAVRDLPAEQDELGMKPLVEGLHALLDDEGTDLPLAIGINAPWGAGKSSVMLQLRRALESPGGNRSWIPVCFDAWKYERGEQLWAAMAKAIYEQAEGSLPMRDWLAFKMRLARGRRGRGNRQVRRLAIAATAVLAVVLFVGAIAFGLGPLPALTAVLAFAGLLGETASGAWGLVGDPFKRAIDRYASRPNYEKYLGFTSEADRDVRVMTEELTKDESRALVVFVDDLDRCSPRYIVDVVEAVNQIFNSSHEARCAFVLGMDRTMVVAGIEAAYCDAMGGLPEGRSDGFGMAFLAKLVQLSVTLPPPDETGVKRLLNSLADWGHGSDPGVRTGEVASRRKQLEDANPADPAAVQRAADEIARTEGLTDADRAALDEAVRLERARLFSRDSRDVERAERLLVAHLKANPREIKRFDNAFRLQLHVANSAPECGLSFDLDDLIALGKSIVLRVRWPRLGDAIDLDDGLLEKLERFSNDEAGAMDFTPEWLEDGDLRALLEDVPNRRPSRLKEHVYLRVS